MSTVADALELVHSSGNVFRDLGRADADGSKPKHFWPAVSSAFLTMKDFQRAGPGTAPASVKRTLPAFATCSLTVLPLTVW